MWDPPEELPTIVPKGLWKDDTASHRTRITCGLGQRPGLPLHRRGKIEVRPTVRIRDGAGLALAAHAGVARVSQAIAAQPDLAFDHTWKANTVLVVTDGTAVLGLGDIGPKAALPVMEGKALLFKEFAGVDAVPICLDTKDTDEIIETIVRIAPAFGGGSTWRTSPHPGV